MEPFRQDSFLSHCCIINGVECAKAKYGLPPGRLLPAKQSDEAIRGGVHFYSALENCSKDGDAKWKARGCESLDANLRNIFSAGIVTIVQAMHVLTGLDSKSRSQWAKSAAGPGNVRAIGLHHH